MTQVVERHTHKSMHEVFYVVSSSGLSFLPLKKMEENNTVLRPHR